MLVRFSRDGWLLVPTGAADVVRGWPGDDGAIWIEEETGLFRLSGGRKEASAADAIPEKGVHDVWNQPDGSFWIGATSGIARYAPPLWRTPDGAVRVETPVHAIVEDSRGRIWLGTSGNGLLFWEKGMLTQVDGEAAVHDIPGLVELVRRSLK